jgi:hypothetical protein
MARPEVGGENAGRASFRGERGGSSSGVQSAHVRRGAGTSDLDLLRPEECGRVSIERAIDCRD